MVDEAKNQLDIQKAVQEAITHHGSTQDELIPILNDVNRSLGYLSTATMDAISHALHVPKSRVISVASFYHMLSTKQLGKHVIKFCESAPCHVVGGDKVLLEIQDCLKIKLGETTTDGKWSLIGSSCLGVCGVGPVFSVDEDIYGNVTPSQISEILARYN